QARLFEGLREAEQRYRVLVESLEAVVWEAELPSWRYTFVSRRAEDLLGFPVEHWLDEPCFILGIVHPDDRERAAGFCCHADTEVDHEREYRVVAADGRVVDLYEMVSVVRDDDGSPVGVRGLIVDATRRKRAEQRRAVHQAVDAVLAHAAADPESMTAVVAAIGESLGWQVAALWVADGEGEALVCSQLWQSPSMQAPPLASPLSGLSVPAGSGSPGRAWAGGAAVWLDDVGADPALVWYRRAGDAGLRSGLAVPVTAGGRFFGVLDCLAVDRRERDDELLASMAAIGAQIGLFVARGQAEDKLRSTVARLRRRSQQLRGLSTAAIAVNATMAIEEILDVVARAARSLIGAHRAVASVTGGTDWSQAVTVVSVSDNYAAFGDDATGPDVTGIEGTLCRTNQAMRLTQAELEAHPDRGRLGARAADRPPMRGWLAAPLVAPDGTNLGLVQLSDRYAGDFSEDDEAVLIQLAQMASTAIHHAQLYEERDRIAEALERGLRPPELPAVDGLDLAAWYLALGEGVQAGGDFYDVFAVGDGRWAVVMGDICGKGPEAAAVTGLVRHTLRAVVPLRPEPHAVLGLVNDALLAERTDRFCALVYGLLELVPGGARLDLGCAGNCLPLVLRADGSVEHAGVPGMVLGLFERPQVSTRTIDLGPGDAMVLYTDGLLDDRGRPERQDEMALVELLAAAAGRSAGGVATALASSVREVRLLDDVAVLVVRVAPAE
ncbi:MAG: SpoIIE family protein phosphatase, partial [Acidimicrobiales bacterium]